MEQGFSALQGGKPTPGIPSCGLDPGRVEFSKKLRGVPEDVFENEFFVVFRKFESMIVIDQTLAGGRKCLGAVLQLLDQAIDLRSLLKIDSCRIGINREIRA